MPLAFPAGRPRDLFCRTCGALVEHRRIRTVPPGTLSWMPVRHEAACGRPCLGAGVDGADYRRGHVHRADPCEACQLELGRVEVRGIYTLARIELRIEAFGRRMGRRDLERSYERHVDGWYAIAEDFPSAGRFEVTAAIDIDPRDIRAASVELYRHRPGAPPRELLCAGMADQIIAGDGFARTFKGNLAPP